MCSWSYRLAAHRASRLASPTGRGGWWGRRWLLCLGIGSVPTTSCGCSRSRSSTAGLVRELIILRRISGERWLCTFQLSDEVKGKKTVGTSNLQVLHNMWKSGVVFVKKARWNQKSVLQSLSQNISKWYLDLWPWLRYRRTMVGVQHRHRFVFSQRKYLERMECQLDPTIAVCEKWGAHTTSPVKFPPGLSAKHKFTADCSPHCCIGWVQVLMLLKNNGELNVGGLYTKVALSFY